MKREVAADVNVAEGTRHAGRFFVQAKLPGDDPEAHPFGQWSLAVEPVTVISDGGANRPFPAFLALVAAEAPHGDLKRGLRLELFRGTTRIGTAIVTRGVSAEDEFGLPLEGNFLPSEGEDFLAA